MNTLPLSFRSCLVARTLSLTLSVLSAGLLLASSSALVAQAGKVGLITEAVSEGRRVTLTGNTHPLATRAADRGALEPSAPANRMFVLLRRSPERELALHAAIQSLHDKNSPSFHKWLTPEQFGAEWGAADSDIATVTAWLQGHGFQVKGPTAGRTAIEFSGTVGQVQEAFHTSIHTFVVNGEVHHANTRDPEIPAALAPVIAGITTLNDFRPKSMARKGPRGIFNAETRKVKPDLTVVGSSNDFLYVVPADAATIYNSPIQKLNPTYSGPKYDGTGAKIGVVGDSNISVQQWKNYRSLFGLSSFDTPANGLQVIIDGSDPGVNGDEVEAYLDVELASALAPAAKVYFYTAADTKVNFGLDLAMIRAVNDNLVDVLNLSFGACEGGLTTSSNQFYSYLWEQAAAQGISVTVSTGDSGSAGCEDPNTQTKAYFGLQVNGLGSTPFNIAVGGTDFAGLAAPDGFGGDFTNYVSETNAAGTYGSAQTYIPEVPWNNSSFDFPPTGFANTNAVGGGNANIVAAGGGKSNCADGYYDDSTGQLVCFSGYPKPSWQAALTPADHVRDLPDVSMFAANGLDYAAWGICTDLDSLSDGTPVKDCTKGSDGLGPNEFYVFGVGGTSASTPAFAGVLALVHQATGERQGQANYVLYNLAQGANASTIFHDVTSGNNSVPCAKGTTDCKLNSVGSYYLTGYDAAPGYDLASGLGSMDISALINNWSSAGLASTTTQLSLTPTSIEHGIRVTAVATVTSGGGTPTGDVALTATATATVKGEAIGVYALNSSGTTGNQYINYLPGGTYNVLASYGGSEKFGLSVAAPVSVVVTPESSSTQVSFTSTDPVTGASSTSKSVPYGHLVDFTALPYGNHSLVVAGQIQPDGLATGTVTFSTAGTNYGTETLSAGGYAYSTNHLIPAGTHVISAQYHGDRSFIASTGTNTLNVVKGPTALTLTANATQFTGLPVTFHVTLSTDSLGVAPTGLVQLRRGSTVLAQGNIVGTAATSSALAAGSVSIVTANLGTSSAPITAVYVGDANYATSNSNSVVVKGGLASTTTRLTLTPTSLLHGTRATVVVTVSSSAGTPTGDVTLTATATATLKAETIGVYHLNSLGTTGQQFINSLPGGAYSVVASYGGSDKFALSVSAPQPVRVTPESSTTQVSFTSHDPVTHGTSTSTSALYGHLVDFRALPYGVHSPIVAGQIQPDGIATGTVTFTTPGTNYGTETIGATGYAYSINHVIPVGRHVISAAYHGDRSFKAGTGSSTISVVKGPTQLTLTAGATQFTGPPVTFHVVLTTDSLGLAPTGTVQLVRGSTVLASGSLVGTAATSSALAAGRATISTTNLGTSSAPIRAVYVGDANYATSTSNSVVVKGRPSFTIGNINVTLPGEHTTGGGFLKVTSVNGYAGTVNFHCSILTAVKTQTPPLCLVTPESATVAANGFAQAQILIYGKGTKLPTGLAQTDTKSPSLGLKLGAGGTALALCLLFGVPARRRGWRSMVAVLLLLVSAGSFTACISTPKKVSAGVYLFRVTATDSADKTNTASATVKVTVL